MTVALALLLATAAAAPAAPTMPSSAAELVDATVDICLPVAKEELKLGASVEQDEKALKLRKMSFGLGSATMGKLGRSGIGLISRSLIGERVVGDDVIVLAVGGAMPGCRSILVSKVSDGHDAKVAELLLMSGWKEAPATNASGAAIIRRMFVRRDGKGQPYLINMMTGTLPASDIRVITTVNPIPPGVQLPQGF
jgi:hypothetical protein